MKVALCISGQPRSVALVFPAIYENVLVPNNPDVYIHSWIDDNIKGKQPVAAGGHVASDTIPHNIDDIILNLYKPKDYLFESQIEFDEKKYNDRKLPSIRPKYSISQRYSIMRSIQLTGETEYDAIIRMRFDWKIHNKIQVSTLPLDMITAPNDAPHMHMLRNGISLMGVNDQFAVGGGRLMHVYGNMFNSINEIFNADTIPFADELMLAYYLEHMSGIALNKIPIKYTIVRRNNDDWTEYPDKEYI